MMKIIKTSDATPIIRSDGSILTPVASPFKLNPLSYRKYTSMMRIEIR